MKSNYEWSKKEMAQIRRNLKGLCADVDNDPEGYDVGISYNKRDVIYEIRPVIDEPDKVHYIKTKLYRNSKGDIIDDEILLHEIHPRLILSELVRVMRKEILN